MVNLIQSTIVKLRTVVRMLGAAALVGMTFLTCADVVGRYFGRPIFGSVEIVGYLAVITVIMALSYTHEEKGHIGVEILFRHFPKKVQDLIELLTSLVSLALFGVITWRMTLYAASIRKSGEVSMNLEFPEHIIIYLTAFCFLVLVLTVIEDIAKLFKRIVGIK